MKGKLGKNKLKFTGRLSAHHLLAPGTYSVLLSATNTAGQTSKTKMLVFTIVKG